MSSNDIAAKTAGKPRLILRWLGDVLWKRTVPLGYLLILSTALSLLARSHWFCDLTANLRIQQVIALVFVGTVALTRRRWKWAIAVAVLLAIHSPWLTSAWTNRQQSADEPNLRVMLANVFTSNTQHELVVGEILKSAPDIVAILELGTPMKQRLDAEDMMQAYPYRITAPQDSGNFGIGLYSKHSIEDEQLLSMNVQEIPTITATIFRDGINYLVIATHPLPPMGARGFQLRNEHLQQLADYIQQNRKQDVPLILMGDLNLTPWSPLFHDLESTTNLRRAGRGYGLTPTWYVKPIFPLGLKLDHVLISDNLTCGNHKIGGNIGSDHRPVILDVHASK